MRSTLLLALIGLMSLEAAAARETRRDAVPQAFWGTWATGTDACKEKDKAIVLSAKAYSGPAGSCAIDYVIEVPGRGGAIYSARMRCSGSSGEAEKKTIANLIIRSGKDGEISAGPTFEALATYHRCSANP